MDVGAAVLLEAILTFFLVFAVYGTAVDDRGPFAKTAGFTIGLVLTIDILVGGPLTGAAMNPARQLGPAVAAGVWTDWWVYWWTHRRRDHRRGRTGASSCEQGGADALGRRGGATIAFPARDPRSTPAMSNGTYLDYASSSPLRTGAAEVHVRRSRPSGTPSGSIHEGRRRGASSRVRGLASPTASARSRTRSS